MWLKQERRGKIIRGGDLHWAMQHVVWYCGGPTKEERKLHHEEVCLLHALYDVGTLLGCYGVCFNALQLFNDCDFWVSDLVRSCKVFGKELALYVGQRYEYCV